MERKCSVRGCTKPHKGRGYCEMHLRRLQKYGDVTVVHQGGARKKDPSDHPLCSIDGCGLPTVGQGLCRNHYMRARRRGGDPAVTLPRGNFSTPVSTRRDLWKVTRDGCWRWLGSLNANGYGHVGVRGQVLLAHRAMYDELIGPIPYGLTLDHLCAKRWCVNPAHLDPCTQTENKARGGSEHFDLRGHG